jgi:hypothetical protein
MLVRSACDLLHSLHLSVTTIRIFVLFCNALPIMLLLLLLLILRSELASVGNRAFDCKVAVVFTLRWLDGVPPWSGSLVSKLLNLTGRVAEADDTWRCTQQPPRGWRAGAALCYLRHITRR